MVLPFLLGLKTTTTLPSLYGVAAAPRLDIRGFAGGPGVEVVNASTRSKRAFTEAAQHNGIDKSPNSAIGGSSVYRSKSGNFIVVGEGRKIHLFNGVTEEFLTSWDLAGELPGGPTGAPASVKISADDREIFVSLKFSPWYQIFDMVTLLDISSQLEAAYRPTSPISDFDYSQNGEVLAICHTDTKGLAIYYTGSAIPPGFDSYDFGGVQPPATGALPSSARCEFANNNGAFILIIKSATNSVRKYNPSGWTLDYTLQNFVPAGRPTLLAIKPDSTQFALGVESAPDIRVFNITTGALSISSNVFFGLSQGSIRYTDSSSRLAVAASNELLFLNVSLGTYAEITPERLPIGASCADLIETKTGPFGNKTYSVVTFASARGITWEKGQPLFSVEGLFRQASQIYRGCAITRDSSKIIKANRAASVFTTSYNVGNFLGIDDAITGKPLARRHFSVPLPYISNLITDIAITVNPQGTEFVYLGESTISPVVYNLSSLATVSVLPLPPGVASLSDFRQAAYNANGTLLMVLWGTHLTVHDAANGYVRLATHDLRSLSGGGATNAHNIQIKAKAPYQDYLIVNYQTYNGVVGRRNLVYDGFLSFNIIVDLQAPVVAMTATSIAQWVGGGTHILGQAQLLSFPGLVVTAVLADTLNAIDGPGVQPDRWNNVVALVWESAGFSSYIDTRKGYTTLANIAYQQIPSEGGALTPGRRPTTFSALAENL